MTETFRRLLAEAIGTLLLVATVVGSGIMGAALAQGNDAVALLGNTLATGAILFVLILSLGPVSGAHFNPAVTAAMLLRREIGLTLAFAYIVVQIIGGLGGTALAHVMFTMPALGTGETVRTGTGVWLSEAVATFGLVFTIFGTRANGTAAVAASVGLFITAGYWFTASTSFANPAVTIARGFTATFSGITPGDVGPFILAQLAGALAATLLSAFLFSPHRG
ncbi:MAG: aquaporin family protein [Alphaproteobacteria bacterium]|nr:aquaporin family protein [Alphaproteobacteria bacterium]